MSNVNDGLLDAYGRFYRALAVLHYEADSPFDFDSWVSLAELRYTKELSRLVEPEVAKLCPEKDCGGNYFRVGQPYHGGRDDKGFIVWFQRWECDGKPAHFHTLESP